MKNLVKAITSEQKKRLNDFINELNSINELSQLDKWIYNDLLPKSRKMNSFKTLEAVKSYLIERKQKQIQKNIDSDTNRINTVFNSGKLVSAKITVEWKKSSIWGSNPNAEGWFQFINKDGQTDSHYFTSGSIGGCGYDKLSTAIARVLNQSNEVLKPLYVLKNKNIESVNRDLFGYGAGYGILPSIEGGVGAYCYPAIFDKIGYKFKSTASGKSFDCYEITKK